jgi:glycosyltransferase involved in cell wall biosynthesis
LQYALVIGAGHTTGDSGPNESGSLAQELPGGPLKTPLAEPVQPPVTSITLVTDNFGGGTGRHVLEMLRFRDLDQWPTTVLCYGVDDGLRPGPTIPYQRRRFRTRLVRFPLPQGMALRDLAGQLPAGPSVLHTYFFWPIMYGRLLKILGKVEHLVENREDVGFKLGPVHLWLLRRTTEAPDLVICVSEAVRRAAIDKEGLSPEKVVVVPNGVPLPDGVPPSDPATKQGAREALGIPQDSLVVGMIAGLNRPVKGVDRLIATIPQIVKIVANANIVIAGDGPLREGLEEQAAALGVRDHVTFLGHLSDIKPLYQAMDISVLTSHSEGLSITLLESMAAGLPVVVTAVGGNPEVVIHGETGFLVPSWEPKAFVDAVATLAANADERSAMGEAGRLRCAENYDISTVSGRYEELYASVVTGLEGRASA